MFNYATRFNWYLKPFFVCHSSHSMNIEMHTQQALENILICAVVIRCRCFVSNTFQIQTFSHHSRLSYLCSKLNWIKISNNLAGKVFPSDKRASRSVVEKLLFKLSLLPLSSSSYMCKTNLKVQWIWSKFIIFDFT